jgi:photosystem II stability/assembly factor-like uncharacterized protein
VIHDELPPLKLRLRFRCPTMDCHPITRSFNSFALAFWLAFAAPMLAAEPQLAATRALIANASPQVTPIVRAMRNDAALNDICFVSPTLGWAVGDRGVIWHTADGGATWHEQSSSIACNLSGVFFLDAQHGWAAGGESLPGRAATRGVILRTEDGGNTWVESSHLVLPSVTGIKFFDSKHGIAFGNSASYSLAGVFSTHNGGNTWQPFAADASGTWFAGDFLAPDTGAVAGPAGQLATLARQKVVRSPLSASSLRAFRAMKLAAPTGGWAVGDGGLLMTTHDLGRSWQTPVADLPEIATQHFDFKAIAVQGTHVWVAGSPGTCVFHSPDDGQHWESTATGQTTPIRTLTFVDPSHGWAAGELGRILFTQDGGHTWQVQRAGGQRAALLAIFADHTDVPLELLADTGAADGYIAAVNILCTAADDASNSEPHAMLHRREEAMLLAGAASTATAWRFPLPAADLALTPADLLQALNRENDGLAMQELEGHLVRQLRTWRPDVVVTCHAASSDDASLNALIEPLVLHAIEAAADPAKYPELASQTGLAPWTVKKVYGVAPPGAHGDELLVAGRFSPWLGMAFGDFVAPARSLLYPKPLTPPDCCELKLLLSTIPSTGNARGVLSGISLAPGSDARRPQADPPTQDIDELRQLATRRRHLQELFGHTDGNAAWFAQVSSMIDGLSPEDGGQLLAQLAEGYRKSGRLDLAADTYFLLARRYPDHPLVDQSLQWLLQFYASSEMAVRLRSQATTNARSGETNVGDPSTTAEIVTPIRHKDNAVRPASVVAPTIPSQTTVGSLTREDRLHRAAQLADYLKTARPAVYAEPATRFAEITAQRELGFANPAQRYFLTLRQLPDSDPWRQCGATEEWLAQPADQPPAKKLANCYFADGPPHLDGKLDEPFWEKAERLRLQSDTSQSKTPADNTVQLTHDAQFLYIAIHCRKSTNLDYATDSAPRTHDAVLSQHDRVTIRLDTDRDYATAFELTVDSRGWTNDSCCGDPTWDPNWYVAAASDDTSWTVEAAVPLAELTDKPITSRQVWAVSARRTIPRVGYQSWAGTASSADSPDQFGLLIFQ